MGKKKDIDWEAFLANQQPKFDEEIFIEVLDTIFETYEPAATMDEQTVLMTTAGISNRIIEHTGQNVPMADIYRQMAEKGFKQIMLSEMQFVWVLQPAIH